MCVETFHALCCSHTELCDQLSSLQVQDIIDVLMAQVLKMNTIIVDQMCAEGSTSIENGMSLHTT